MNTLTTRFRLRPMPAHVRAHFDQAMLAAHTARAAGALDAAWSHLERAHVLGQAWIAPHLRSHAAMLLFGWQRRDLREVLGQLLRLALVVPGTLLGRLPLGNTGGANVHPLRPLPLSAEVRAILESP
jgi:hypothetical protein